MIVKKYIKFELKLDGDEERYIWANYRGCTRVDLDYIVLMMFDMDLDGLVDCANNKKFRGWQSEAVYLDACDDEVEITSVYDIPHDIESYFVGYSTYESDYTFTRSDFKNLINNYKLFFDGSVPYFYLILLQGNRVVLQEELSGKNLIVPKKWLEYVKVAYVEEDSKYLVIEASSSGLDWLPGLFFHLSSCDETFEWFRSLQKKGRIPDDISFDEFKQLVQNWKILRGEESPVYFVKLHDGSIAVRKNILDLKYIKMALNKSGKYEIVDEYGVGVFDFLEGFVLYFSAEDFLNKCDRSDYFYDVFLEQYGPIKITWCKKNNSMSLSPEYVSKVYEYIERDRARYKEDLSVKMSLDYFKGLISYWFSLQQKQVPEIYFTQKEDGAIVIRESLN